MPALPDNALDVLLARALRQTQMPCPRRTAAVRARLLEAASQATAHQQIAPPPSARPLSAALAALVCAVRAGLTALIVDDCCFYRTHTWLLDPQYDLWMVRHALTV
ncbi:MAG: hypothetical protein SNJ59_08590 [Aggregatilineales bacterium]